ncbi:hypothetical protein M0813_19160 [Anaeramoeba flamelloides]|uniref:Uncharacterized protein n=1 Tax=Anaeramoeba flamelloides TaxID=1746091 RepID=A0ABQ8YPK5_9EUKA|nr:hypothetical protein M0813_19160 [Anaeramoeba flamelloides]
MLEEDFVLALEEMKMSMEKSTEELENEVQELKQPKSLETKKINNQSQTQKQEKTQKPIKEKKIEKQETTNKQNHLPSNNIQTETLKPKKLKEKTTNKKLNLQQSNLTNLNDSQEQILSGPQKKEKKENLDSVSQQKNITKTKPQTNNSSQLSMDRTEKKKENFSDQEGKKIQQRNEKEQKNSNNELNNSGATTQTNETRETKENTKSESVGSKKEMGLDQEYSDQICEAHLLILKQLDGVSRVYDKFVDSLNTDLMNPDIVKVISVLIQVFTRLLDFCITADDNSYSFFQTVFQDSTEIIDHLSSQVQITDTMQQLLTTTEELFNLVQNCKDERDTQTLEKVLDRVESFELDCKEIRNKLESFIELVEKMNAKNNLQAIKNKDNEKRNENEHSKKFQNSQEIKKENDQMQFKEVKNNKNTIHQNNLRRKKKKKRKILPPPPSLMKKK